MGVARIAFLIAGSVLAVVPWKRGRGWLGPAVLAVAALALGIVPFGDARAAGDNLSNPIAFLLLAVPLAVLLDQSGFFASLAGMVGHTRHLVAGLWCLAALVTIVFNLDAAVVLLTPLYVRIAERHDRDPVLFGFIPALLASLASSVLPVSNLTNLIVTERLDLDAGDFVAHLALPTFAAVLVGGWLFVRQDDRDEATADRSPFVDEPVDPAALRVGFPVVAWLLIGFVVGERVGIPEWIVVAVALIGMAVRRRELPWRHVPYQAAVLAVGLGVLASAAARHLAMNHVVSIDGIPGELATIGVGVVGANAINNLPALLVALPALDVHHERAWAVLLGVNLGPTLWVSGALSTLLWQATMRRLGHPISAGRYARQAARIGLPAIGVATATRVLMIVVNGS